MWTRRRSCGNRPCGHKSFPARIDGQIEAFEGARSKKQKITRFGADHLIDGEELVESDDRKANTAGDLLAVREDKTYVLLLASDTDSFKRPLRNPGVFTSRVHQNLRYGRRAVSVDRILDLALAVERPHTAEQKFTLCYGDCKAEIPRAS